MNKSIISNNDVKMNNSNQPQQLKTKTMTPKQFIEQKIIELETELKQMSLEISEIESDDYLRSIKISELSMTEMNYDECKRELEWIKNGTEETNEFIFDIEDYSDERLEQRIERIYKKCYKTK